MSNRSKAEPVFMKEACCAYLSSLRARGAKSGSIRQMASKVQVLDDHFGGMFDLSRMAVDDLNAFIQARLQTVKAPTVNNDIRVLRAVLYFCTASKQWPAFTALPLEIKEIRHRRKLPTIVSEGDLTKLIAAAESPADLALLIAAKAGLRHQEILHMERSDVQLDRRLLLVQSKEDWTPKSWCEREVPIGAQLAEALKMHLDVCPGRWLFPGYGGRPRTTLHRHIVAAFEAVGIYDQERRSGLHMLRRTWATSLLGAGVDIETVRQLGGWADLETVQRYITSTDERKRSAIERLG